HPAAAGHLSQEAAWHSEEQRLHREMRRGGVHYHSKRHMLPTEPDNKRRPTERQREREIRKKPSGHLAPLQEDDMDNDEVVSVAIGPPPMRPKYEKLSWKHSKTSPTSRPVNDTNCSVNQGATNVVKDVLSQLGRELLSHEVSEDFIFGQYVGNAMKNLTGDLKLKMQHEILEVVVRYQKTNRGELLSAPVPTRNEPTSLSFFRDTKEGRKNETTDETWPDFSNLAKIVG
ncbi:uncharacterized protein LOC113234367, partial [Hyposmocoma kahamanoa]|uniref:uncharacterized protein LOC113234367 n=1 Tax=Hyposmocoma kahamanoa TaxID=1477025 RepID=UPI000E6D9F19